MFNKLTDQFSKALHVLAGQKQLTEAHVSKTLSDIRKALLDADVALKVVQSFIDRIRQKAIGQTVTHKLRPDEFLTKLVYDELVKILGEEGSPLNLNAPAPVVIMLVGLQGVGKTTCTVKLANHIKQHLKKSVIVASVDRARPAAVEQLTVLAQQADIPCFPTDVTQSAEDIVKGALSEAKKGLLEVLILDTPGSLHINEAMMASLKSIHKIVRPLETLLVLDSMAGQDAVTAAETFNQVLPLTGIIGTKADEDGGEDGSSGPVGARCGAILSVNQVVGKPIKFLGVGEKIADLEPFHPDRIASKLLGKGDLISLIEKAQQTINAQEAEKMAKNFQKGRFTFEDLRNQMKQMQKLGGMSGILKHMPNLPGMGNLTQMAQQRMGGFDPKYIIAIVDSMTQQERNNPQILTPSRKKRIQKGCGRSHREIEQLIKMQEKMQKMMKQLKGLKGGNIQNLLGKFLG